LTPQKGFYVNNARQADVRQAGVGLFWDEFSRLTGCDLRAMLKPRFAPVAGEKAAQSSRGAEVTAMKYYTPEFIDHMHRSITGIKADPRAGKFDEAFYQEMYGCALRRRLEQQRKARFSQEQDPVEAARRQYKPMVDAGLMKPQEFREFIKRAQDLREIKKKYPLPPFDEAKITENFNRGLVRQEEYYRKNLPEEIYRQVADPRVLALHIASPEVVWAVEADKRFVDAAFQAAEALEAGVPERIVRLLYLHDARVERAERRGDALTLRFEKSSDNYYRVRKARFLGCDFLKWNDPTGWYWGWRELERLPDGRYSVEVLFRGADGLMELELIAQDIEIDSPTTLEDLKAGDERFQRLLDIGVLRKASEEDMY